MDEAARQVFVKNKQYIKQNLHLDDCILDYLEAKETLTSNNVESVQAERTNGDRISRLILILQRKGPTAFDKFLEALTTTNTEFLADELRKKYEQEKENLIDFYTDATKDVINSAELSLEAEHTKADASEDTTPKVTVDIHNLNTRNQQYMDTSRRSSIQYRRLSEQSTHSQGCLNNMYHKLKMHLFKMNERELSYGSPAPVTIEMVEGLVDRLLKIEQDCYNVLRVVHPKSLLSHIIDLKEGRKQLQKTIDNKEEQTKKYAGKIFKLDHRCKDLERTIKSLEDHHKACTEEKEQLQETVEQMKQGTATEHVTLKNQLASVLAENNQLKSRLSDYDIELNRMSERIKQLEGTKVSNGTIISTQSQQRRHNLNTRMDNKQFDSKHTDLQTSQMHKDSLQTKPSTLQDCKDICAAPDPNRLTKLRAKVLFAESMKSGGHVHHQNSLTSMDHSVGNGRGYITHSRADKRYKPNSQADWKCNSKENINDIHEDCKISKPSEAITKLTEKYSKQGKLKSPLKKQPSLKRRPTWSRKPLK